MADAADGRTSSSGDDRSGAASEGGSRRQRQGQGQRQGQPITLKRAKRRPKGIVCAPCRELKVVCSGSFPCYRCWRLALPCRPQEYVRPPPASGVKGLQGQGQEEEQEQELQRGADEPASSPLLELVFTRMDSGPIAEIYARAFIRLHASGQVVRESALAAVRHQMRLARLFGLDPTWGYSTKMAEAIGCTPIDLATPQEVALDPPPMTAARREAALQALREKILQNIERVKGLPFFAQLDQERPGAAMDVGVLMEDGNLIEACNAGWDALVPTAGHFFDEIFRRKTMTPILIGSLCDPSDREAFLDAAANVYYAEKPVKQTAIVKMFDGEGEMQLFLFEASRNTPPPAPGSAAAPAQPIPLIVARLEPLNPSRHLTLRPGHRAVMQAFQAADGAAAPTAMRSLRRGTGMTAPDGAAFGRFPGLACVPLSAPPDLAAGPALAAPGAAPGDAALATSPPAPPDSNGGGGGGGWHGDASAHATQQHADLMLPIAPSPVGMEVWHGLGEEPGPAPVVDATLLQSVFDDEEEEGGGEAGEGAGSRIEQG